MRKLLKLVFVVLLLTAASFSQSWSGVLAPARAIDWTNNTGVPGGIPSGTWTQSGSTISSGASTATIQSALNACTANHYVLLGAGSFTLTTSIHMQTSRCGLFGSGPTQTTINENAGANILFGQGTNGQGNYPTGLGSTTWSGGLTRGSLVLTVASTTGMSAGQPVVLDQHNAPWVFTFAVEGECTAGNSCGRNDAVNPPNTGSLRFNQADTRAEQELVLIHSVDSSTQITIEAPGVSHDYNVGQCTYNDSSGNQNNTTCDPQVFFWNTPKNVQYMGIENLTINNSNGNDFAYSAPFCDYCWVRNVAIVSHRARAAIFSYWSYRPEIVNNYIGGSTAVNGPTDYAIDILQTSLAKVENNIVFDVTSPLMAEGSYGCVVGYNYFLSTTADNTFASLNNHLGELHNCLWEGNINALSQFDFSWGGGDVNTMFRNRSSGKDPNKTNYRTPMMVLSGNRYQNLVANVFGDSSYHINYQCDSSNVLGSDNYIYDIGFFDGCVQGLGLSLPTGKQSNIASFTGTSGTLSFTTASGNLLVAGEQVVLTNFTGGNTGLNQQGVTVLSAGLSGTTFQAAVTGSGYSSGTGKVSPYDTTVGSSLMRWGNWDAVTYCANGGHAGSACNATGSNGVRFCTGSGAGNPACTASETANSDPLFPGLASPATTFAVSWYTGVTAPHASCGTGLSFWKNPSDGTCPPYPPIGPDVSGGDISNTAGHAYKTPAQRCYESTAKNGSGFLTGFDAANCYSLDPAAPTTPPAAFGGAVFARGIIRQP